MNIVIISNLFPPQSRGGAEQIALKTARALAKKHNVTVLTLSEVDVTQEAFTVHTLLPSNIFSYLKISTYNNFLRLIWRVFDTFNIVSYLRIKKILNEIQPDIVLTHNLVGTGLLTSRLLKRLQIKHMHTLHDIQLIKASGQLFDTKAQLPLLDRLYAFCTRSLMQNVAVVMSPSQALMNFHQKYNFFTDSEVKILPNPNDIDVLALDSVHHTKSTQYYNKFLFLGQVEQHKGILPLVHTIQKLNNEGIHTELHVVGGGSLFQNLDRLYKNDENIHFYGRVEHNKIIKFIDEVDYVVVPSLCFENSPTVIYESFARLTPVIAHDVGGITELVHNDTTGILISSPLADTLEAGILQAYYVSPDKYRMMQENIYKQINELSLERYIQQLEKLL